jgi:hypothetical protein
MALPFLRSRFRTWQRTAGIEERSSPPLNLQRLIVCQSANSVHFVTDKRLQAQVVAAAAEQCGRGHAQRRSRPIDHMPGSFAEHLVPTDAVVGT